MAITETQIYALAAAKQTAKGTPATQPTKRFIQVGGDVPVAVDTGTENYSDLDKFGDATDWINSVLGRGQPGLEADSDGLAYIMWLFNGAETVTANATNATLKDHVAVPAQNTGFYSTWWKRVGQNNVQRIRHDDCRISQVQLEGSTANKAVRVTPDVISLDPQKNLTADPTWPSQPAGSTVLIYTEAAGTFKVDTVTVRGHTQFTLVLNEDLAPVFTDDTVPYDVRRGQPVATLAITIQADADGQAQFNKLLYGTATPINAQAPSKRVSNLGAYEFNMLKLDGAGVLQGGLKAEVFGVRWNLPDYPGPSPDGGDATLALAGSMRKVAGTSWKTTVTNGVVAYTT
jgi:hypothetical protein